MKANEIKGKGPVDTITLKVTYKDIVRDVRGGELKVCDVTGEDDTGKITVSLWNDDIAKVEVGNTITIVKGWANEFQGRISVSAGKFGTLEVQE